MAQFLAKRVYEGKMLFEKVPYSLKEEVRKILDEKGWIPPEIQNL